MLIEVLVTQKRANAHEYTVKIVLGNDRNTVGDGEKRTRELFEVNMRALIKNLLKRRKKSDTYLATVCRNR